MTPYSDDDLADDWEFKIMRSTTGAFRKPAVLQRVLEEERQAGWTLVEKFDDGRIRLKRPAQARQHDAALPFDPYRTWVGASESKVALGIVALCGLALAALLIVIALTK